MEKNLVNFRVLLREDYVMFNVIRMIDWVIGIEPEDFSNVMLPKIEAIKYRLFEYCKTLKPDTTQTDRARVKELIMQLESKWKILRHRTEECFFAKT